MENAKVLEYKCPCCNGALHFGDKSQRMTCPYCDNEFDLDTVKAYNESLESDGQDSFDWAGESGQQWAEAEQENMRSFLCPSCGGEILTDENTAATFCPYCDNPTILPGRLSGGLKPDGVIPFKLGREDAQAAFRNLCKGKPLLPKFFTQEQRVEKITGIYVPFWLYDCGSDFRGSYKATRVHHWSDANYNYTKTDHFQLIRGAVADFERIPMDASSKMADAIMESIEPFDYSQMVDFETAYLSGYLADKYDVEAKQGQDRVRQRVSASMDAMIQQSLFGYTTVVPVSRNLRVSHSRAKYVLLPVWVLNTRYKDQVYTFAMNAQTGKMTGSFPVCPKRTAAWFAGICAGVTALAMLVQYLVL